MSNVLGFPIGNGSGGGEFTPIVKYDARAGRIFRVDRVQSQDGFDSVPVDITATFKAIFDLDNIQTGWMLFTPGAAPAFVLVPLSDVETGKAAYPAQPGDKYKSGVRFMMKLNKSCGGDSQIREIAGQSSAFLTSIAALYEEWKAVKAKHPGQLPVVCWVSPRRSSPAPAGNPRPTTTRNGRSTATRNVPTI